jgi:predicted RNA-binding Zn ribbon-like protein
MRVNENRVDLFESDEDVLLWLKHAGLPAPAINDKREPLKLLCSGRELRESIRSLVEKRKTGRWGDPAALNRFLAADRSYAQLVWSKSNKLRIDTVRQHETAESILAPVAEAAANLLTTADFNLVKRCEEETCELWFYDQTKSHRRRWCSMERCGNRHKVAAYRARRSDLKSSG